MGNPGDPRKHHYVSAFYLAGFTREGTRDGTLHVLDLEKREQRVSSPNNEGIKRDFNKVNAVDPFVIEKRFGDIIETPAAKLIRSMVERRAVPDDPREFDMLMTFIACLSTRVLPRRNEIKESAEKDMEYLDELSRKGREYFFNRLRSEGERRPELAWKALEEWRRTTRASQPPVNQNMSVLIEMDIAPGIINSLSQRHWTLFWADVSRGLEFATCDDPVLLSGFDVVERSNSDAPEGRVVVRRGFDVSGTDIIVPLANVVVLKGKKGQECPAGGRASVGLVESVNELVLRSASRYVWSARPRFRYSWSKHDRLRDPTRIFNTGVDEHEDARGVSERQLFRPAIREAATKTRKAIESLRKEVDLGSGASKKGK